MFAVHVSDGRWQCACVFVCGGGGIACGSLFFCDLVSKSLCVFCWLLEAQDE